jgi:hypothetical protein
MRLYEEIFKNADGAALARCVVVPDGGGYFEGVKAVEDFSSEKIILCFLKERVELLGDGLTIKKYCDGDLQLAGEILSLRVLVGEE